MTQGCEVSARFFLPPPDLQRYFTTFYEIRVVVANGGTVTDYLHPEWAGLRFISGDLPEGKLPARPPLDNTPFVVTGPTSTSMRFRAGTMRMWGIGLLPLGWAKFVGANAADEANTLVDGRFHPSYAGFAPLAETLFGVGPGWNGGTGEDLEGEVARITAFFRARLNDTEVDEARILACHEALINPDVHGVSEMAERAGVNQRTLERICLRHFGFPPKLLLRRQRFMRSLAQFLLNPKQTWIDSLDGQYHDQAQFVRDFRLFMDMTPRQYAALDHPIIDVVVRQRMRGAGAAVQALHWPQGAPRRKAGSGAAQAGD